MMNYEAKKSPLLGEPLKKVFNKHIEKIGKTISVESKVNVVGSAKIQRSIYYSDYDLFEEIKDKSAGQLYSHFRSLYLIFEKSESTVIADLKLGDMHWSKSDLMNRIKNGITFDEALSKKEMVKLDIITFLNGRFIEITEVYKICIDGKCNMDYEKESVLKEISDEYKAEIQAGNFMKSLKKMFSIIKLGNEKDPRLEILIDYFNSPMGLLYRCKADLETLITAMAFSKFKVDDMHESLEMLKEIISAFPIESNLEEIIKINEKRKMLKPLMKQVAIMKNYLNKDAKRFISRTGL